MADVHRMEEFRIVLGDSLKDNGLSSQRLLSFRYNSKPDDNFATSSGHFQDKDGACQLVYESSDHQQNFNYSGWQVDYESPQLALFYDEQDSKFVLEQVAASFNLNLNEASNRLTTELIALPQIASFERDSAECKERMGAEISEQSDRESEADEYNPFDYRHHLAEARENSKHGRSSGNGHLTPLPGSATPLSGLNSPLISARLLSSPQGGGGARIVSDNDVSRPPKKRKIGTGNLRKATTTPAYTNRPRTGVTSSKTRSNHLSTAEVLDSDSSDNDTRVQTHHKRTVSKNSQISRTSITITAPEEDLLSSPRDADLEDNSEADDGELEIIDNSTPYKFTSNRKNANYDTFGRSNRDLSLSRPNQAQKHSKREINSLLLGEDSIDVLDHTAKLSDEDVSSVDLSFQDKKSSQNASFSKPTSRVSPSKKKQGPQGHQQDNPDLPPPPPLRTRRQSTINSTTLSQSNSRRKSSPETSRHPPERKSTVDADLEAELRAALEIEEDAEPSEDNYDDEEGRRDDNGGVGLGISTSNGYGYTDNPIIEDEEEEISEED